MQLGDASLNRCAADGADVAVGKLFIASFAHLDMFAGQVEHRRCNIQAHAAIGRGGLMHAFLLLLFFFVFLQSQLQMVFVGFQLLLQVLHLLALLLNNHLLLLLLVLPHGRMMLQQSLGLAVALASYACDPALVLHNGDEVL